MVQLEVVGFETCEVYWWQIDPNTMTVGKEGKILLIEFLNFVGI